MIEIAGDSLMTAGIFCWEFMRVGGRWQQHEEIRTPTIPGWYFMGGIFSMSYDGQTLLTGFHQAQIAPGVLDPAATFWERNGTWTPVWTVRGSDLGLPVDNTNFGVVTALSEDLAAISATRAPSGNVTDVGAVFTFRRVSGVWQHEQTLHRPGQATHDHGFGMSLAMDQDWLFAHCSRDIGDVPSIYAYRRTPGLGWQLHSKISPTVGNTAGLPFLGLGAKLDWVAPYLAVTAGSYIAPPATPGAPANGVGAVFVYELCGDVWNQHLGLAAPPSFGYSGIGTRRDGMAFDGETIAVGGPDWWGGSPPVNDRGIAAVAEFRPGNPGSCLEVGRIACDPSTPETTDCPCGLPMTPGRGCPNPVGPGARLYVQGGFNEAEARRVLVEGLPPESTVLLAVGRSVASQLPAGVVNGDGVWCIDPIVSGLTRVARADAAGNAVFDHVILQPHASGTTGWQIPLQALYRSPAPSTCGGRWNATQAVQVTISSFGYHLP
ncbi:MAG: hypothetical protein R3F49_15875 [Planctomycetota bacterium]